MKIGVFGCGNMGSALCSRMKDEFPEISFFLYSPGQTSAFSLASKINGRAISSCEDMPKDLDLYLLAFKPQSLEEFHFDFKKEAMILSILAGTSISTLQEKFKSTQKIARLMPNLPSSLGLGANLLHFNPAFNLLEKERIERILKATGKIFIMESEARMNTVTVFSGSGPGLIFELARIFEEELNDLTDGQLPAKEIVAQTFLGSSNLLMGETSFTDLRNQVTSKNGVTYEALSILEKNGLKNIFARAFKAGIERTIELSNSKN